MGVITILILTPKYHPIENLVPIQKCDLIIKNGDFTKQMWFHQQKMQTMTLHGFTIK